MTTSGDSRDTSGALIDISVPYSPTVPVWPGDTAYSCGWVARRESGSSINLGAITTSVHAGTHADAPLHVESDWAASESLPCDVFVGECVVLSLGASWNAEQLVTRGDIEARLSSGTMPARLLLHTGFSVGRGAFPATWPTLHADAITWLIAGGLRLFGTDAPSVDARDSKTLPVHRLLFTTGAYILENLSLDHVAPGRYELLAQPTALVGADAAPVRALLRQLR